MRSNSHSSDTPSSLHPTYNKKSSKDRLVSKTSRDNVKVALTKDETRLEMQPTKKSSKVCHFFFGLPFFFLVLKITILFIVLLNFNLFL